MTKLWIVLFVVWSCLSCRTARPRRNRKPIPRAATTTVTSFDPDHTVVGWVEIIPFESKIFHNTRMLRVLVPANYYSPHNAHRSYPVLYMQDGQNLFDDATSNAGEWHVDETVEHLVGSFKIPPMFVVGIDNAGAKRSSEYLPYPDPLNTKDGVRGRERSSRQGLREIPAHRGHAVHREKIPRLARRGQHRPRRLVVRRRHRALHRARASRRSSAMC